MYSSECVNCPLQEVCTQYWPSREGEGGEGGGSVTHDNVTITAGSVKHGTLTQRTFSVLHHSQVRVNERRRGKGESMCILGLGFTNLSCTCIYNIKGTI